MKTVANFVCILVLGVLGSCSDSQQNYNISLELNETKAVTESLSVTFKQIVEDSRCPINVECVWQGRAVINLDLLLGDDQLINVTLIDQEGSDEKRDTTISDYYIKLNAVRPYPEDPGTIEDVDYIIDLFIEMVE